MADTIIPALDGEEAAEVIASLPVTATDVQRETVVKFATEGFVDHADVLLDAFARQCTVSLSGNTLSQISTLLSVLSTRPGTLALTGNIGPFPKLDRKTRESVMLSWMRSPIALLRGGAIGIRGLLLITFYKHHETAWQAMGYPKGVADDWNSSAKDLDAEIAEEHYPYVFENDKLSGTTGDAVIETDVLVVGSGAGGGVAASYLAERGVRVLVVDKGIYLRPQEMNGSEKDGYKRMYEGDGLLPTEDSSLIVLAGSTFGGGTTVNWSASLKPRHFLRHAWATKHGVPRFLTPTFTADLNAVCTRMGASTTAIKHNISNSLLALGAQRAGQPVEAVPQNTGGHVHYCGKCQFGCVSGHKQGGTVTFLRDAAENGAAFMTDCNVERVLFDNNRKALGAIALVAGRKVTIKASKGVVVAGGSIQTPAVLLRTPELKYNTQIGKNLHLHPTTFITGYYDFPIKPWEGGLLTMVSNASELVDAEGWGAKIEVIASSPGIHAGTSAFPAAVEHKSRMLRYSHSFTLIVITRDRDSGKVFLDKDGNPRMDYSISSHDQKSMLHGILRACDIHMMAGASEIYTSQGTVPAFRPAVSQVNSPVSELVQPESTTIPSTSTPVESVPRDLGDPAYVAWQQLVIKSGCQPNWCGAGSAHQMGSCRMGANPKTSALDPEGRVWGAKNLWVADASALPEASGVNPMVTTMAVARGTARNIAKELGVEHPSGMREARL